MLPVHPDASGRTKRPIKAVPEESGWRRAANAVADLESSALFSSLEATAGGEINRSSDNSRSFEQIQLEISSAYEIDLWGRIRSSIEAEQ